MIDYILLFIAVAVQAVNFASVKLFQRTEGSSVYKALLSNFYSGIFTAVIFFVISGFKVEVTAFSLIMAALQTILVTCYSIVGLKIIDCGNMTLYSVFLMSGGMIVPYVWGLAFLGEPFSVLHAIGLVIIAAAVVITNGGISKSKIKVILMCIAVFFLNGFVSVVSKEHQIGADAVSTNSFIFLASVIKIVIVLPVLAVKGKGRLAMSLKPVALLALFGNAASSGISYMLQLIGAKNIDASILYPVVTGGTIIFAAIGDMVFFREKPTRAMIAGIALCFLGTCMFVDFSIFL